MTVLLLSCSGNSKKYSVYTSYGFGWGRSETHIRCDSVKMLDAQHVKIFIDGTATDIYANQILISRD